MVKLPLPSPTAFWQKSSASPESANNCVEITSTLEGFWVRDSKNPRGPILGCTRDGWAVFLSTLRWGGFHRCGPLA